MTLDYDQRSLLYSMGGWQIVECLSHPDYGVPYLFQTMWGGTRRDADSRPDWKGLMFRVHKNRIELGRFYIDPTDPVVTITRAQLMKFAKALPAEHRDRLIACRDSLRKLASAQWHCRPDGLFHPLRPLEACRPEWSRLRQEAGFSAIRHRIYAEENAALRAALEIDVIEEPSDLFELLAMQEDFGMVTVAPKPEYL